jgi:hypothetical protein
MKPYFIHRLRIKLFLSEVRVFVSKYGETTEVDEGTCGELVRKKA